MAYSIGFENSSHEQPIFAGRTSWLGIWILCCISLTSCNWNSTSPKLGAALNQLAESLEQEETWTNKASDKSVPAEIQCFCGDCHALPNPDNFDRDVWYDEIQKGYEFYASSGRTDLQPPAMQSVIRFYRERAPSNITFPAFPGIDAQWRSRFEVGEVDWRKESQLAPAVSSIRWVEFQPEGIRRLVVTDMRDGSIDMIAPMAKQSTRYELGSVGIPARVTPCDLNLDGYTDLIVSDLGSFNPYDHEFGRVVWLKRTRESFSFEPIVIAENLGRVADVAVSDFSGDLRPDVIVAEFGHRQTGSISLLTQSAHETTIAFRREVLDIRPGAMQLAAGDWNGDGNSDFAAIFGQEFECVDLFINQGRKFDRYRAGTGSDLTFGSVAMEVVDLDGDDDHDIIFVNGDSFDNNFVNRTHGIQWLENTGNLEFTSHRLAELPGAYKAVASDIDGDGDLDIIAVTNLPSEVYPHSLDTRLLPSVVVLEQLDEVQFRLHVLEQGTQRYPALEVADFNDDGKLDFAVGTLLFDTDSVDSPAFKLPHLKIWWQK